MGRAWRASACNPLRAATDIRPPFVVTPDQVRDDEQESPLATPNPPFAKKKREPLSRPPRSDEHTSELQSLMRISYAVFCLKKNTTILHSTLVLNLYHHTLHQSDTCTKVRNY